MTLTERITFRILSALVIDFGLAAVEATCIVGLSKSGSGRAFNFSMIL